MLERQAVGNIPSKHHIVHKNAHDGSLYWEECFTREGFEGPYTIMYHQHRPHEQMPSPISSYGWEKPIAAQNIDLRKRHFTTQTMTPRGGMPINSRIPLLFNNDISISIAHPDQADDVYFNNADADELLFIFEGSGTLRSILGDIRFQKDDYLYIPKGLLYRLIPDTEVKQYWLSIECFGGMGLLKQWRNEVGQLRMDAPYCHRDFKKPDFIGPLDEGIRRTIIKRNGNFYGFEQPHSILDVVGWDGSIYPWVFPILAFQPRAGLTHLPPTWHGTFSTKNALICSFVPRSVDFHPEAIPCPYPHSSVDCDEFLFYCRGNFTSRKGVGPGSISLHPMGLPHGPHPGAYEASIGHEKTTELAVMIDTFQHLHITEQSLYIEDQNYMNSFLSL